MEIENKKVFYSDITRDKNQPKNYLFDLINIIPAVPLVLNDVSNSHTCNFVPKIDKIYIPKGRPKVKVKTVRDIRDNFENDTYAYLTKDLDKQHNYLLKQIINGSSKSDKTMTISKKILRADSPISRPTWQILTNINPENLKNNRQFVLWNKRLIQVNGSIGGKRKFLYGYDLANTKLSSRERKTIYNVSLNKKKCLLRNSLAIKFKPGPLGKKKLLDESHQKCNGDIELVNLPRIGLDILPRYGTTVEPTIMSFLNNLRKDDGTISQKWAEFAVSVLGHIEKSNAKLQSLDCVTFDLNYKYNQRRILMRKYLDDTYITKKNDNNPICHNLFEDQNILPEIENMMSKMLDAIEISVNQDSMFTYENDIFEIVSDDTNTNTDLLALSKEKMKRKYCELNRLDVTVITLPDSSKEEPLKTCRNLYCTLGCVCESIKRTCNLRDHCGREECMFECECDFSKYTSVNSLDFDTCGWIPTIKRIEDNINLKLAKEEQKFHQTVIVTGEKNILIKSGKRNWKSSRKYDNFYKNMCLKNVNQRKPVLSVHLINLNCENVEPWCMVHNLYKCFCKGKFTSSNSSASSSLTLPEVLLLHDKIIDSPVESTTVPVKQFLRPRVRSEEICGDKSIKEKAVTDNHPNVYGNSEKNNKLGGIFSKKGKTIKPSNKEYAPISRSIVKIAHKNNDNENKSKTECFDPYEFYCSNYNGTCSRVIAYEGRKYSEGHYKNTNEKIKEMEKNDRKLQEKMMTLLKPYSEPESNSEVKAKFKTAPENVDTVIKDTDNNQKIDLESSQENDPEKLLEKNTSTASSNDPNFIEFFYDIDGLKTSDCGKASKKPLPNKHRLVSWIESNYKFYKECADKGLVKTSLEPPKVGKVALYSWEFILGRYKDRKNIFLVSKQKPYRIFMGVNTNISIFQTCMNINEIRFADLHKYPQTIKNLLTNATDLEDNFCILRGYANCWELVGSVAKVSHNDSNAIEIIDEMTDADANLHYNHSEVTMEPSATEPPAKEDTPTDSLNETDDKLNNCDESDSSKWFVMTVENDFHEIRFYKKGFFVKYESILKAIDVARLSGKTVRLSSQKCVDGNSGPQFGVYAIPNASEYCVFIGPYELQDSLGIETVKTMLDVRKTQNTRGFWITTNKVDNLKVIDNPMSFMPLSTAHTKEVIPLENNFCGDSKSQENPNSEVHETATKSLLLGKSIKHVKPIKVSKGLYQMASDGSLKKISLKNSNKVITYKPVFKKKMLSGSEAICQDSLLKVVSDGNAYNTSEEDAPQIKITAVYSQKDVSTYKCENKRERSMFILKPEEINRKLLEGEIRLETESANGMKGDLKPETESADVAKFELNLEILSDDAMKSKTTEFTVEQLNVANETSNIASESPDRTTMCSVDTDVCVISDDDSETG